MTTEAEAIQRVVREHHGALVARLIRVVGSFDLAEDALQEAVAAALTQWPAEGIPDEPRAWLMTAAKRRAIDELRKRGLRDRKQDEVARALSRDVPLASDEPAIRDDMLRLMFTCCHPALEVPAQIALTLNTLGGLSVEEIARAFLVPTPTMAQRLVRAKRKIQVAGIPYEVPEPSELGPRVEGISRVVYLIFNEGYTASRGAELIRAELCDHALRLARELCALLPDDGNVLGLYALLLLQDSRRDARVDATGDLVLLDDQDRSRWDRARITEGVALTRRALSRAPRGVYPLQAAIAAVHAEARTAAETDWRQIVALYDHLLSAEPSAVVALNRAVAVAMAFGPDAGLPLLAELESALDGFHLFHAARADLLRRAGHRDEARAAFQRAHALCDNDAERRLMEKKIGWVSD